MNIPEGMPVLSGGSHRSPADGACVMEYVSLLAGEPFSDHPSCTHPVLARAARVVNDHLPNDRRHLLVPLIGRLFGTSGGTGDRVLGVRLAAWCARQMLPMGDEIQRSGSWRGIKATEALRGIEAAEAWADNPCKETAAAAAAYAGDAYAASYTAAAASYAYTAGDASYDAAGDAYAASAVAAAAAATQDGVDFLTGLIDEYDRLTGRTAPVQLDDTHLVELETTRKEAAHA